MSTVVKTKRCAGCSEEKPLDAFYRHRRGADGRRPRCKECESGRERPAMQAYAAALQALRRRHQDEFDEIYADELIGRSLLREVKTNG